MSSGSFSSNTMCCCRIGAIVARSNTRGFLSSQLGSMQMAARKGRDTAYGVSKAALNMLSVKSAAALRDDGVGVVMLHPGWIATDLGGPSAPLDVEDTSRTIASTIEALTIADSVRFVRWDGHDHPW